MRDEEELFQIIDGKPLDEHLHDADDKGFLDLINQMYRTANEETNE